MLTAKVADPTGYGRIVRDRAKRFVKIVEEKDSSNREKKIREINTGTYAFDRVFLEKSLPLLTSKNSQNEFYLTDVLSLALGAKRRVVTRRRRPLFRPRRELARGPRAPSSGCSADRKAAEAMAAGTTILRPETVTLDETVVLEAGHGARALRDAPRKDARGLGERDRTGDRREGRGLREERDGEALLRDRVGGRRRRRDRGPVRAAARGNGPRRGRSHRELRRDEEGRAAKRASRRTT